MKVSIPIWFDLKFSDVVRAAEIEDGFNSNMVRFKDHNFIMDES